MSSKRRCITDVGPLGSLSWWGWLCWAAFALACSPPKVNIGSSLPEGTALVAAIFYDETDAPIGGAPLLTVSDGQPIVAEVPAPDREVARVDVYGYAAGQLGADLLANRTDAPLRLAQTGDPELPTPAYYAVARGQGTIYADPADGPQPVTADWLPRCPTVVPPEQRVVYDVRCVPQICAAPVPVQSGCTLRHDLTDCGLGVMELDVDGLGNLVPRPGSGCTSGGGPSEAALSYSCNDCRVDVYIRPWDSRVTPFSLTVADVLTVEGPLERAAQAPFDGFLSDLLVQPDQVVVSHRLGVRNANGCSQPGVGSGLSFRDKGLELSEIRSTTVAGCLSRLAKDPTSDGFFAFSRRNNQGYLVHFSHLGQAQAWEPLPDGLSGTPVDFLGVDEPPSLILALHQSGMPTSTVVVFDPATLKERGRLAMSSRVESLGPGPEQLVVIGADGTFAFLDPADATLVGGVTIGTGIGVGHAPHAQLYLPGPERLLALDGSERPGITVTTRNEPVLSAVNYLRLSVVSGAAPWPTRPERALVGTVFRAPNREAGLMFFDALEGAFLPEVFGVGTGPITAMHTDTDGQVYFLLPWSAQLGRTGPY